jgi:MYXO-CTERM domain-containing protein
MRHASDIPTMYVEVLAADDDDGDLSNGTPHVCTIIETFGAHGLRAASVSSPDLSVEPEDANAYEVAVKVEGLYPQCPTDNVTEARVVWSLERTPHQRESITMSGGPEAFKAEIPKQTAGEVVSYHVDVDLEVGTSMSFPDNEADPKYAFFVGNVTPIYCTDFENDPEADGWTHGLISGSSSEGADDWTWGVPQSTAESGDPDQAYSGTKVFGNDLGGGNFNGTYQPDKVNYAASPVIDVSGHAHVRLQYRRWLRVEDGLFDQATIYANDKKVWSNYASPASSDPQEADTHHVDREWRFHDVSLTDYLAEDTVQIKFEIASDQRLEMGGWAIDDFCIVAYDGEIPGYEGCGNGRLDVGETCDDGNRLPGDGCDTFCQTEDDEVDMVVNDALPNPGGGCECGVVSNVPDGDDTRGVWALLGLAALAVRRRRRS